MTLTLKRKATARYDFMKIYLFFLVTISVALGACSSDDEEGANTTDQGTSAYDSGTMSSDSAQPPSSDTTQPSSDTTQPAGDTTQPTGDIFIPDHGNITEKNSGVLCEYKATSDKKCPVDGEDKCMNITGGRADYGMCLIQCTYIKDDNDHNDAECPDVGTNQKSVCLLEMKDGTNPSKWFCAYVVEFKGETYGCPSGTKKHPEGTICAQ